MTVSVSDRRWTALLGLLLLAPLALLVGSAEAATHVVTLSGSGPSPSSLTIPRGDTVTFRNTDNVSHTITHNAGSWSYQATIAAGASASTPAFTAAGTFGYDDSFTIALFVQHANGSITVTAPKPTPTRSATPTPTRSPTPSPTASRSARPTPTPSGTAIGPPIGLTTLPPVTPTRGPTPDIAPPSSASQTPMAVAYGDKSGLVQSSPHRYGLPVALALVAALGLLSLIVRLLLTKELPDVPAAGSGRADGGRW